jgi:chromosome segregation ATPase
MPFVLSLLTNKVTWIFLAIAAVVMMLGVQQARVSHLKGEVAEREEMIAAAKAEIAANKALIDQWQGAYKTLTTTVLTQNTAINKLEAEVAQRMARAKEAIRLADAARVKADGLAEVIQQMEVAKDECTGMRQLIDAYSGRVQ